MKIWVVNGISRLVTDADVTINGICLIFKAETEAEAIGLAHKEMERLAPDHVVLRLWANDATGIVRSMIEEIDDHVYVDDKGTT